MTKEIRCANCGCPPHAGRPCENTFTLMVGPAGVATKCTCSTYEPLELRSASLTEALERYLEAEYDRLSAADDPSLPHDATDDTRVLYLLNIADREALILLFQRFNLLFQRFNAREA